MLLRRDADRSPDRQHDSKPRRACPHCWRPRRGAGAGEPHGLPHERDRTGDRGRRLALAAHQLRLLEQPQRRRGPSRGRSLGGALHGHDASVRHACAVDHDHRRAQVLPRAGRPRQRRDPRDFRNPAARRAGPGLYSKLHGAPCLPDYDPQLWMRLSIEWLESNCAEFFPRRFDTTRVG